MTDSLNLRLPKNVGKGANVRPHSGAYSHRACSAQISTLWSLLPKDSRYLIHRATWRWTRRPASYHYEQYWWIISFIFPKYLWHNGDKTAETLLNPRSTLRKKGMKIHRDEGGVDLRFIAPVKIRCRLSVSLIVPICHNDGWFYFSFYVTEQTNNKHEHAVKFSVMVQNSEFGIERVSNRQTSSVWDMYIESGMQIRTGLRRWKTTRKSTDLRRMDAKQGVLLTRWQK